MQPFFGILLALLLLSPGASPADPAASAGQSEAAGPTLEKMRSVAESQHEIVTILIRKKEYAQALEEAGKIFDMKWPPGQEPLLLKSLLSLSGGFLHEGQPGYSLQLLERNRKAFKTTESRVSILKEMGYIYKNMNNDDKALECFREAQRLESGSIRER